MSDPTAIRSIAVHRDDVATALEATLRSERLVVLRVTPPFAGRMRARLHEASTEADPGETVHVDPRDLVEGPPPYPEVDETAERYPDASLEERRERHAEAVAAWRENVRNAVVDSVVIDAEGAGHRVDVVALG